uniref:DUF834 domain-containing protein n=1 Tax=Oryza rufipogon TaxID=4529 RepID=A0A0E0N7C9_ORYRU
MTVAGETATATGMACVLLLLLGASAVGLEMAAGMEVAARLATEAGSGGEAGIGDQIQALEMVLPRWRLRRQRRARRRRWGGCDGGAGGLRQRLLASMAGDSGIGDGGRLAAAVTEETVATVIAGRKPSLGSFEP